MADPKSRLYEIKAEAEAVESRTREVIEAHPGILGYFHPERLANAVTASISAGSLAIQAFMESGSPEGRQTYMEVFKPSDSNTRD